MSVKSKKRSKRMNNLAKTDVSKMEYIQKISDKDIADYLAEATGW